MSLIYRKRILRVLKNSDLPIDIEKVRTLAGIGNWETAKALLLELLVEGVVRGQKSTKSWVFWMASPKIPKKE